jgi:hypothetical protein
VSFVSTPSFLLVGGVQVVLPAEWVIDPSDPQRHRFLVL